MRSMLMGLGLCACAEDTPEIWVDRSPIELGVVRPGEEVSFSLQIRNAGGGTLEVAPFSLRGDDDCAFALQGPDVAELSGPMQGFVQGSFVPTREGVHQVALYLSSNAEALPNITVPICALVDAEADESTEACVEPATDAANCPG